MIGPIFRRCAAAALATVMALGPAGASRVAAVEMAVDDAYPLDDAPLALEDQVLSVSSADGVLANDAHDAGAMCVADVDTTGLDGTLAEGTVAEDGSFVFTPSAESNGETTFTYDMAVYSSGSCPPTGPNPATVTIDVTPVNDLPTAELGSTCAGDVTVPEDSGAFDDGPCVAVQAFGPSNESGQGLDTWVVSSTNSELFASGPSVVVAGGTNGRLQFAPAANASGSATVTVRARDDGGIANGGVDLSPSVTFTLTVTSVNDPPTANADSFIALPDRTLNVGSPGVLANDTDLEGDALTASKATNPAHGVVTLAADGSFSYTPTAGYLGFDAFSYRASDGVAFSVRIVTLNVTAIPTPIPTVAPPSAAPSAAPSASLEPSSSPDPSASIDPNATPSAAASAGASLQPSASPAPGPSGDSGGLSIPVLVVLLLLISLLAFGAAVYVPKWLERQRTGEPMDEG